jgi:hypothetical protein
LRAAVEQAIEAGATTYQAIANHLNRAGIKGAKGASWCSSLTAEAVRKLGVQFTSQARTGRTPNATLRAGIVAAIEDAARSFRDIADALNAAGLLADQGGIWRSSEVGKRCRRLGIDFSGQPNDVPADWSRADATILDLWTQGYRRPT